MAGVSVLWTRRLGSVAWSWSRYRIQSAVSSSVPSRKYSNGMEFNGAVRWRYAVDDRTHTMMEQVKAGIMSMTCINTLNAATPITPDLMHEALNILYWKIESLRICFRMRENHLWVADMPAPIIDFQYISEGNVQEEYSKLVNSCFNTVNGPLWKVRLVPSPDDSTLCLFPEVKERFSNQYELIMSFHHAANDGVSALIIIQTLFTIIDQLLQGISVDCSPIGELHDSIGTREEEERIRVALEADPSRLKAALKEYQAASHVPLIVEALGTPMEQNTAIYDYPPIPFDEGVMERIINKCRSIGVTINSFMIALYNTSLVEVVRDAGLNRSSYPISSVHPVSCRRLMKQSPVPYLGFHGLPMTLTMDTPHDVKDHFWEYVTRIDADFRAKIKRNAMCEEVVLRRMLRPKEFTPKAHINCRAPPSSDYLFSNLYAPTNSIEGIGKLVQLTSVWMKTVSYKAAFPVLTSVFTLRGKVFFMLTRSTNYINDETTSKYRNKNLAFLHDISRALT